MSKKSETHETVLVRFVKDFDGHKTGDEVEILVSELVYFEEWAAVEVLEGKKK
jgi:hypothetical protein